MDEKPRLLLAEDEPELRDMLHCMLEYSGFSVECVANGREALEKIKAQRFHLLLTDWAMPGMDGPTLCRRIREAELPGYLYILLLTGQVAPEDAVAGLEAGADDYIRKPADQAELLARLNAGWRIVRLEQSLREANEHIRLMSVTDPLVGTYNRRYLDEELTKEIERSRRYRRPLAAIMADLDYFKRINDQYGHQAGDEVLRHFGTFANASIRRASDWIARYGGEEFAIVLPDTGTEGAAATAEKIRSGLESIPASTVAGDLHVTASFGVALLGRGHRPADELAKDLLQRADEALYRSKLAGRNRVTLADS